MAKLLNIGGDQKIRLLTISHSLSDFGSVLGLECILIVCMCVCMHMLSGILQGICGVTVSMFVKTSVNCLILCCLAWTKEGKCCPLASRLPSMKTWLFRLFQISVTIGIAAASITTDGYNAASCWLHWPQFGRSSGVLAGWLERLCAGWLAAGIFNLLLGLSIIISQRDSNAVSFDFINLRTCCGQTSLCEDYRDNNPSVYVPSV